MLSKLLPLLRSVFLGFLSLLATASLAQTTIHVGPGQPYTTIQSGIDAANAGDTVLVAPGTYNENIDFKGKAITVTSSGGASKTIIDGGYKPGVATVIFANAEARSSILSGFTIRGGGDTIFAGASNGGIYVKDSAPTIQNNTITANYCHNIDVEQGAAAILNNVITDVLVAPPASGANTSYCIFRSAVHLQGTNVYVGQLTSTVIGNIIENNLTGSAINLWTAQNVLIQNNNINNNTSPDPGSAFTSANSVGTVIAQNLVYKNTSTCGGALAWMDVDEGKTLIVNNTLVDNVFGQPETPSSECTPIAQIYPDPYGLGQSNPNALLANNIVSGSTSYPSINCDQIDTPSQTNQPLFRNDDFFNASGPFFGSYCGDLGGTYNTVDTFFTDPYFVDASKADYHLKASSPAIDSGYNTALDYYKSMTGLELTTDFDGKPRIQDASSNGCTVDMGAYEYPATRSDCGVTETLTSSLNPAQAGDSVTFTAQLTAQTGTPTGLIEFLDGSTLLGSQAVSSTGSAAFNTSTLTVGSHTITANYQPTGNFGPSTASLVQVINGNPTTTTLTCSPNPISIGATAILTASVISPDGTPTGSVIFTDNGSLLATVSPASGNPKLFYVGTSAGTHTITATYNPTGSFASSFATCTETVNALPTVSLLDIRPRSYHYGIPVHIGASVVPVPQPGPSTPTGSVTFFNGSATLGTVPLSGGLAVLTTSALPTGTDTLTCAYNGSSIYASSTCAPVPVTIQTAPTTLTLTSSRNPAIYGSSVTLTAALAFDGQSAGAGNTILLTLAGKTIPLTTTGNGSVTYTFSNLSAGNSPITANFAGTDNLLPSSASLTQVITPARTSIALSGNPNPGNPNQGITLTATLSSQTINVQQGSVTFYDGTTSLGSSPLSNGATTLSARFSTLGVHNLTAVYPGDANFIPSTSPIFKENIIPGDFSINATPSSATLYTGQSTTAEVALTSLNGFNQPVNLTCTSLPTNATCAFTPDSLPSGQGTVKLVIQTAAPHKTAAVTLSGFALGALALLQLPARRRRRSLLARLSLLLLAAVAVTGITACGAPHSIIGGTPPGTYQIAVTGTTPTESPALTHSATFTITVKSLF